MHLKFMAQSEQHTKSTNYWYGHPHSPLEENCGKTIRPWK